MLKMHKSFYLLLRIHNFQDFFNIMYVLKMATCFVLLTSKADILNKAIISPLIFTLQTMKQKTSKYRMFGISHEIKWLKNTTRVVKAFGMVTSNTFLLMQTYLF